MVCTVCSVDLTPENKARGRKCCKPCVVEKVRAWRAANPEKKRVQNARDRQVRREQRQAYDRSWRKANPDKCREQSRRSKPRRMAKILQENRNYRARKAGAPGQFSVADMRRLLSRSGGRCFYCPQLATTADHVVPLSRGGTNFIGNIVPACRTCNSSKNARTIMEWRRSRG